MATKFYKKTPKNILLSKAHEKYQNVFEKETKNASMHVIDVKDFL